MQIQSQKGSMVLDYYPTKNHQSVKLHDKVLKVLTFRGRTILKKVISTEAYINEVYERIHKFKYVDNKVDHSNCYQFVSSSEVN